MWVKMADHQRRQYYVIRVRSLTQAKLANRAAHDEETRFNKSPCVSLCGIPVVNPDVVQHHVSHVRVL